ncbi:MAG: HAD family hydrolase, partial [Clostridia bacterium]|nr:HAD family hydrolase [Clostridia bacterium]
MGTIKPNAKFYRHALDVLGVEPSRVIMIGDAERDDILGANAVGIRTCYIMGKTDKEIPPEADYYVLGPADLI